MWHVYYYYYSTYGSDKMEYAILVKQKCVGYESTYPLLNTFRISSMVYAYGIWLHVIKGYINARN